MTQSTMFGVQHKDRVSRRDPIFDVLVELYYPDGLPNIPKSIRKDINAVAAGFRSQKADACEIRDAFRAARAARERGDAAYDAAPGFALLKHFGRFRDQLKQELSRRYYLFRNKVRPLDENLGLVDPITYLAWMQWSATEDPPHFVGGLLNASRKDYRQTILRYLTHWSADEIKTKVADRVCLIKKLIKKDPTLGQCG